MIIRKLAEIETSNRNVSWGNGLSRRLLLEEDGMGYTITDTIVHKGTESYLEYKNHLEACYCIEGEGEIEIDQHKYSIRPGTLYALNKHDAHILRARTTLRLICVFNPPLKGEEKHSLQKDKTSHY